MATAVELQQFQGNAGLALPAGVATPVSRPISVVSTKKVPARIQAIAKVGLQGIAAATAIEVIVSITNSAGVVVASSGALVDIAAGGNVAVTVAVAAPSPLPADTYTLSVTAQPQAIPGVDASCRVQPQAGDDVGFISLVFLDGT